MEKINLIALKKLADRVIYQPKDGFTNLSYMLDSFSSSDEFLTIEQVESQLITWLDADCSYGDGTWTSHGNWIWHSWLIVKAILEGMGF